MNVDRVQDVEVNGLRVDGLKTQVVIEVVAVESMIGDDV